MVVYDDRGALKALLSEDGTSLKRAEIAMGKAYGALALGVGSRALHKMATDRPYFIAAATHAVGGQLVPVPGGVLIKDAKGEIARCGRRFRRHLRQRRDRCGSRHRGGRTGLRRGRLSASKAQVFVISGFSKILG